MKYHAPTKQFTVSSDSLDRASRSLLRAIKHIRLASDLDPKGYTKPGLMDSPQFAENGILRAARELGIDLGAYSEGELDVSDCG